MKSNKRIAVLGAAGKCGQYIVNELLMKSYEVNALIYQSQISDEVARQIKVTYGNALDHEVLRSVLTGCDAVISALGQRPGRAPVYFTALRHVIQLMNEHRIKRYIGIFGLSLDVEGDQKSQEPIAATEWVAKHFPEIVKARAEEFKLLEKSNLDWTVIRIPMVDPTIAINEAVVKVNLVDSPGTKIHPVQLAQFIVQHLNSDEYICKAPFVGST